MIPPNGPPVNHGLDSAGRMQSQQEQHRAHARAALLGAGSREITYERAIALIEAKGLSTNAAAGALAHLALAGVVRVQSVRGGATFVEILGEPQRPAPPAMVGIVAPPVEKEPVPMPPPSLLPQGVLLAGDAYRAWLAAQALRYPAERCAEGLAVAVRLAELPDRYGIVSSAGLRLTFELRHLVGIEGDARGAIQAAERHVRRPYNGPQPPCGCDHPEPRWCRGCGAAEKPLTAIAFHDMPACRCPAHPQNHQPTKGPR